MSFTHRALHIACLVGAAIAAAPPASQAADKESTALPVVAEHKYRMRRFGRCCSGSAGTTWAAHGSAGVTMTPVRSAWTS